MGACACPCVVASPPPPPSQTLSKLARYLPDIVYLVLYGLLLIAPVIGIVTFVYHGRALDFGLFEVDWGVKSDRAISRPTQNIHAYLAYAIFGLAGLHVLAALWHQFLLHDGLLGRMWLSND